MPQRDLNLSERRSRQGEVLRSVPGCFGRSSSQNDVVIEEVSEDDIDSADDWPS